MNVSRETHMTTMHVQCIGDKALLPQSEFACLVEQEGAFDFWQEEGEDIYSFGIQDSCGKSGEV